jgi:arylsulfatase A-like enzyme
MLRREFGNSLEKPMKYSLRLMLSFVLIIAPLQAAVPAKPNILFIAIDDLNHWTGYLGRNKQVKTPNIDRLASRGVWFSRSYCAAPVCNPSRAALMSGLRPGTSGVYDNGENFAPVIPTEITLTSQFRKAGYHVSGAGKIYHGSVYRAEEWDDWLKGAKAPEGDGGGANQVRAGKLPVTPLDVEDAEMPDYKFVDYAIGQLNKKHDKPFFVACGLTKPHLPWSVPKKYYEAYPLDKIELPPYDEHDLNDLPAAAVKMARRSGDHEAILQGGETEWKRAIQAYFASIAFCDAQVGRLIEALDKSAYKENTIIVLWGDHGWHLGEKQHWRKFALWEESTRAPLIWVVPGLTQKANTLEAGRCARTVDYMSIYPTLMDLCGLPIPPHVQGKSIRTLLENPQAAWAEPAITTYRQNNHSIRTEQWRYTRYADGGEELYNEITDPYEWKNEAKNAGLAGVKTDIARFLPQENKPHAVGKGGKQRQGVRKGKGNRNRRNARKQKAN